MLPVINTTLNPVYWTLLIIAIVYFVNKKFKRGYNYKLAPGPRGLPLIGLLGSLGDKPYKTLNELSKKHGNVMSIQLGAFPCVILGDFTSINEAYKKEEFLGRPEGFFRLSNEYTSLAALEGLTWREHKRATLTSLRNLGMGKNQAELIVMNQVSRFIEKLDASLNQDLNVKTVLSPNINNIIYALMTGKTYDDNDPMITILRDFHNMNYLISPTSCTQHMPWLAPLILIVNSTFRKTWAAVKKMEECMKNEIKIHEDTYDGDHIRDFIDEFLKEIKQRGENPYLFNTGTLLGSSLALLLGGSDTVRITLEWSFMYMAHHQDIQEKAYLEIEKYLGNEKPPSWKDKDNLPYVLAVLLEASRIQTLAPLGILRSAQRDGTVQGYDIPKGTCVIANFWSVHMSPEYFREPETFKPERFLSAEGKLSKKLQEFMLPFSYGKRNCPGELLANVEMFLFFVSILQKFRVSPPDGGVRFDCDFQNISFPLYPIVRFASR